jgi:pimeloyl-ACP methyl ester carboxylesterase
MHAEQIWHERGGDGARTVLLLHGLGATGAVWRGVQDVLKQRGSVRWIAIDLSGHGFSRQTSTYSVGQLAADLAALIRDEPRLLLVGHSLGTYVALALASGWFGLRAEGVLGIGPKLTWSDADHAGMRELASRPIRWYQQESEATARYRRVSGITVEVAAGEQHLARGVTRAAEGFRLSQDPRAFLVGQAPFDSLVASARCPVLLARGEHDPMVSLQELRMHCPDAFEIPAAGHNVHVEKPQSIADAIERMLA